MSFLDPAQRRQCCHCHSRLSAKLVDDGADACSRICARNYALLSLEGKLGRAERTPSPLFPPSAFSPVSSNEELPELPGGLPESAHVSLESDAVYRESDVSTAVRSSAVDPVYIDDYPFDDRLTQIPTRPATPTPDSANQQERPLNTRLVRFVHTAIDRRADRADEDLESEPAVLSVGRNGGVSTLLKIVAGVSLKRSRSDSRPAPPAHIHMKSRLASEQ